MKIITCEYDLESTCDIQCGYIILGGIDMETSGPVVGDFALDELDFLASSEALGGPSAWTPEATLDEAVLTTPSSDSNASNQNKRNYNIKLRL